MVLRHQRALGLPWFWSLPHHSCSASRTVWGWCLPPGNYQQGNSFRNHLYSCRAAFLRPILLQSKCSRGRVGWPWVWPHESWRTLRCSVLRHPAHWMTLHSPGHRRPIGVKPTWGYLWVWECPWNSMLILFVSWYFGIIRAWPGRSSNRETAPRLRPYWLSYGVVNIPTSSSWTGGITRTSPPPLKKSPKNRQCPSRCGFVCC